MHSHLNTRDAAKAQGWIPRLWKCTLSRAPCLRRENFGSRVSAFAERKCFAKPLFLPEFLEVLCDFATTKTA